MAVSNSAAERSDELLERSGHLAALDAALASVRSGLDGRFVLVGGEAGVGKTMLVRRFCDDARGTVRILSGVCDSLFTPRPLGPFIDVAEQVRGELGDLVAAGARPDAIAPALLRELRREAPTVLVLEDLHWADEATLDILRLVARRVETVPALVVGTYRDSELDRVHPLRVVIGEIASSRATRVAVEPLSPAAVATLAEPRGVDATELHRKTAGNPFFVVEVLASAETGIPDTVRDAVLARAARLTPAARALLEAVASVPPQAELWLLEAIAGRQVACLEECLASGMLSAGPGGVAFRHELGRLAIEEGLAPDRRAERPPPAARIRRPAGGSRSRSRPPGPSRRRSRRRSGSPRVRAGSRSACQLARSTSRSCRPVRQGSPLRGATRSGRTGGPFRSPSRSVREDRQPGRSDRCCRVRIEASARARRPPGRGQRASCPVGNPLVPGPRRRGRAGEP